MQQLLRMNKSGPLWSVVRLVLAFRSIIAIVLLLLTVVYLMFSETLEQRRYMLTEFSASQREIALAEGILKDVGDTAFNVPSTTGGAIHLEDASALADAARELRSVLLAAPAPTSAIEGARAAYATVLADVLGAVNLYSPDDDGESTIRILHALEAIERPAVGYADAARSYQTSVWVSFWAAL